MSGFIDAPSVDLLSVAQAVERLGKLRKSDSSFIHEAATVLVGLFNNREILKVVLWDALSKKDGAISFYSPQSFLIASGEFRCGSEFTLRGNVWFPQVLAGANQVLEDFVYSYNNCHDHNFDFLTVGYLGPGYSTDMYEYSDEDIVGIQGEAVNMRFRQTAVLAPGKVLYFRKSKDIHVQRYPSHTSVSVNLLMPDADLPIRAQFEFDVETKRIVDTLYSSSMFDVSMANLIGQLQCVDAIPVMQNAMLTSPMWQHRYAALKALVDAEVLDEEQAILDAVSLSIPHEAAHFKGQPL